MQISSLLAEVSHDEAKMRPLLAGKQIRELQGKLLNLKIKIKKLISVIYPR